MGRHTDRDGSRARLYLHRRLDVVAPGWRSGEPVPWPDDPAERLVWCIRRDSGASVPTPAELNGLLTSPPATDAPSMLVESMTTMGAAFRVHTTSRVGAAESISPDTDSTLPAVTARSR